MSPRFIRHGPQLKLLAAIYPEYCARNSDSVALKAVPLTGQDVAIYDKRPVNIPCCLAMRAMLPPSYEILFLKTFNWSQSTCLGQRQDNRVPFLSFKLKTTADRCRHLIDLRVSTAGQVFWQSWLPCGKLHSECLRVPYSTRDSECQAPTNTSGFLGEDVPFVQASDHLHFQGCTYA